MSRYDLNEVSPAELLLDEDGLKKSWIFASSFRLFISSCASKIDLLIFLLYFKDLIQEIILIHIRVIIYYILPAYKRQILLAGDENF